MKFNLEKARSLLRISLATVLVGFFLESLFPQISSHRYFYERFRVENPQGVYINPTTKHYRFKRRAMEKVTNYDYRKHSVEGLVKFIDTPKEAQIFCEHVLRRDRAPRGFRLQEVFYLRFSEIIKGDEYGCGQATIVSANLLRDNGFPAYGLILFDKNNREDHLVYAYMSDQREWGSVGINTQDFVPPIAKTVDELIMIISKQMKVDYKRGILVDLDRMMPNNYK